MKTIQSSLQKQELVLGALYPVFLAEQLLQLRIAWRFYSLERNVRQD